MIDRYSKQELFSGIGVDGQRRLAQARVVVVGCGALGTVTATILARAGIGRLRIVDRDFIELHNLQRQVLFDEEDIKEGLPKAIAAERHLRKINSTIAIEGIVADVNYANIENLVKGADLIIDGLDNLETRYLINDVSLKHKVPWVYGGAISSYGLVMAVIPGTTSCLRCVWGQPSGYGQAMTCDTAGVISPAPFVIGSLQSVEAMKILTGQKQELQGLVSIDVWKGIYRSFKTSIRDDCPSCHGKYEYLEKRSGTRTTSLCGQNAVQVTNPEAKVIAFPDLAKRLNPVGTVTYNDFMLNFTVDQAEMVIFPDGRAIVKNTGDESLARGLYAKYVGA
jgi:molybdopterin-synthase adenylyltransferase